MEFDRQEIESQISNALYTDLAHETVSALVSAMVRIERRPEETLITANEEADGCFYLCEGVMRVVIEDVTGSESWPALIGRGQFVGEVALIDRQPRSATVVAMTDCLLGYVSQRSFNEVAARDQSLYRAVAALVCKRLRQANRMVCDERLGLEGRLAATFLRLAEAFGEPAPGSGIRIAIPISQERLAQLVAASRENVNRQLRLWREQQFIRNEGQRHTICAAVQLERLSGTSMPSIVV